MLKIGQYNDLTAARATDNGLYLSDGEGNEVLLPNRYYDPETTAAGDRLRVFVYTDSDDRPVATTEVPFATAGQFAFLQVKDVNRTGAWLDWGLPKDLLVPYSEQKSKMTAGGIYLVYVYLDAATGRVVASARVERYLGNVLPDYRPGQHARALVVEHTPIGYRVIVDNLHWGMVYNDQLTHPLEIEQTVDVTVKGVRPDGKIDLTLAGRAAQSAARVAHAIIERLIASGGSLAITDDSAPEIIRREFGCSKKDYKKALGHLYKQGKILIGRDEIALAEV